jgi:spore maturation protein CgeB
MNAVILNFRKGFPPLRDAFESLGFEVAENLWTPPAALLARTRLCIVNLYEAARQPLDAVRLKWSAARCRVPVIAFDRDAPWHMGLRRRRLLLLQWLKPFDVYATHTLQPTYEFAPVKLYNANAVWTRHFNLHGQTLEAMRDAGFYALDVSFLGNMNGKRYQEHARREEFFGELSQRLAPSGIRFLFADSAGIPDAEQIRVIQRSRINLSYRSSCDHENDGSWGLPERCYGVPARGGFLLSDARRHAADDFELATEWASYLGIDDCVEKIRYYLGHFEETRRIAEAAHARVMQQHTYQHRARNLLAAADAVHGSVQRGQAG